MDRFVLRTGSRLFRAVQKATCVDLRRLVMMPYKNKINNEMVVRVFYLYFGWNAIKKKKNGEGEQKDWRNIMLFDSSSK